MISLLTLEPFLSFKLMWAFLCQFHPLANGIRSSVVIGLLINLSAEIVLLLCRVRRFRVESSSVCAMNPKLVWSQLSTARTRCLHIS